jgi:hypothetical protein
MSNSMAAVRRRASLVLPDVRRYGRPCAALALLAAAGPAFAGAWTVPQGHGQVIITTTASRADDRFDSQGNVSSTPRYQKLEAAALVEYGLTDRLTAIVDPGFQHVDIAPPIDASRTGAGYTEFGARFRFLEGKDWVVSAQGLMRVPGTSADANPAAIGYTSNEFDARVLFGANLSIAGRPAFANVELAQRFRDGAPNEFRADATLGVNIVPRWTVVAQSFTVIAESGSTVFPAYNYSKLQLSVIYAFAKDWSLQLGAVSTVFGHNALQENGLVAGIGYRF